MNSTSPRPQIPPQFLPIRDTILRNGHRSKGSCRKVKTSLQSCPAACRPEKCGGLPGHMLAALAGFERDLMLGAPKAGLKAAKKRGVKQGRKPSVLD
ncbi:MAG: hypothetical protein PHH59_15765 [Methylovulum sp.]|uniref:hypothetical protein n=1 Tax=Methylovulum sp. TaxID=1916980 RepID=UPI002617431A|nr:hypothetical protein [Methylovulum sp.]MDD2725463.1 hypothetical protein [Methylovulum sp.]MDD5125169.1 hypothetical protein [Methylovulum sp.]